METDFMSIDNVHELTQYLRGELFFFVDSILSLGEVRMKKQLEQTQDFMKEVLTLIFRWMMIYPSIVSSYALPVEDQGLYQNSYQAIA